MIPDSFIESLVRPHTVAMLVLVAMSAALGFDVGRRYAWTRNTCLGALFYGSIIVAGSFIIASAVHYLGEPGPLRALFLSSLSSAGVGFLWGLWNEHRIYRGE